MWIVFLKRLKKGMDVTEKVFDDSLEGIYSILILNFYYLLRIYMDYVFKNFKLKIRNNFLCTM